MAPPAQLTVDALNRYVDSADHLLRHATQSVGTFWARTRFRRDSLDVRRVGESEAEFHRRFTTGGGSVTAALWSLRTVIPSLEASLNDAVFKTLLEHRDSACAELAKPESALISGDTFGQLNPFTVSVSCYQLAASEQRSRATSLAPRVLLSYAEGWPVLANVDHEHPYPARAVMRCAEKLGTAARRGDI